MITGPSENSEANPSLSLSRLKKREQKAAVFWASFEGVGGGGWGGAAGSGG